MERKMWAHWAHPSKKGQAILELALFGSILIFCLGLLIRYGLTMNYSQHLQMQAFRQAVNRAYAGRNTFVNANYTILEDKPIPDPADPFGVSKRSVFGASASAVWSNQVYGKPTYGATSDLPRVDYQINDKRYTFAAGAFKAISYRGQALWKRDEDGDWERIVCCHTILSDIEDNETARGWECPELVSDFDEQGFVYAHVDGLADDRDGDGDCEECERREEMVIDLETQLEESKGFYYTFIRAIKCIDFQEGQIDMEKVIEGEQGISGSYTIVRSAADTLSPSASLRKEETPDTITTTTTLNTQEKIKRTIKTNLGIAAEGDLPEVPVEISTPAGLSRSISFSPSLKEVYVEDTFTKDETTTWQANW